MRWENRTVRAGNARRRDGRATRQSALSAALVRERRRWMAGFFGRTKRKQHPRATCKLATNKTRTFPKRRDPSVLRAKLPRRAVAESRSRQSPSIVPLGAGGVGGCCTTNKSARAKETIAYIGQEFISFYFAHWTALYRSALFLFSSLFSLVSSLTCNRWRGIFDFANRCARSDWHVALAADCGLRIAEEIRPTCAVRRPQPGYFLKSRAANRILCPTASRTHSNFVFSCMLNLNYLKFFLIYVVEGVSIFVSFIYK